MAALRELDRSQRDGQRDRGQGAGTGWTRPGRPRRHQKWDKLVAAMFDYESRHRTSCSKSVNPARHAPRQLPVTRTVPLRSIRGLAGGAGGAGEATRERFATLARADRWGRKLEKGHLARRPCRVGGQQNRAQRAARFNLSRPAPTQDARIAQGLALEQPAQ